MLSFLAFVTSGIVKQQLEEDNNAEISMNYYADKNKPPIKKNILRCIHAYITITSLVQNYLGFDGFSNIYT